MTEFVTIAPTTETTGIRLKMVQAPSTESSYSYAEGVLTVDNVPHTVGGGTLAGMYEGITETEAQAMVKPLGLGSNYWDYVNETNTCSTAKESLATAITKAHLEEVDPDTIIIIIEIIEEES